MRENRLCNREEPVKIRGLHKVFVCTGRKRKLAVFLLRRRAEDNDRNIFKPGLPPYVRQQHEAVPPRQMKIEEHEIRALSFGIVSRLFEETSSVVAIA